MSGRINVNRVVISARNMFDFSRKVSFDDFISIELSADNIKMLQDV